MRHKEQRVERDEVIGEDGQRVGRDKHEVMRGGRWTEDVRSVRRAWEGGGKDFRIVIDSIRNWRVEK